MGISEVTRVTCVVPRHPPRQKIKQPGGAQFRSTMTWRARRGDMRGPLPESEVEPSNPMATWHAREGKTTTVVLVSYNTWNTPSFFTCPFILYILKLKFELNCFRIRTTTLSRFVLFLYRPYHIVSWTQPFWFVSFHLVSSLRTLQLPFFYLLFFIFIQPQDIFAFNLLVHTNCKSYGSNISFHLLIFRLMYIYTYFFLVKCTYVLCLFINSINWIFMHLISLKVMAELGFGRLARKIRQISYQISIHSYN